ncbi:MAG: RNase adaptor protein RapZ, partial [Deltaproteobacteria bacterium]|nr:RNase adaptor protein RapZ [Deltaproteobacteria bacterium]
LPGNDKSVQNYVMKNKVAENFQKKFLSLINFLIPQYKKEGKTYLAIGVGCTGGQHRSVVVINSLEKILSKKDCLVRVVHRDLGKG